MQQEFPVGSSCHFLKSNYERIDRGVNVHSEPCSAHLQNHILHRQAGTWHTQAHRHSTATIRQVQDNRNLCNRPFLCLSASRLSSRNTSKTNLRKIIHGSIHSDFDRAGKYSRATRGLSIHRLLQGEETAARAGSPGPSRVTRTVVSRCPPLRFDGTPWAIRGNALCK